MIGMKQSFNILKFNRTNTLNKNEYSKFSNNSYN